MRVQASSHWEQSSQLILRIVIYIHLNSCLLSHANNLSDICISSQHCPLLSKPQLTIFLSVLEHSKLVSSTEKALPLLPSACVSLQDLFLFPTQGSDLGLKESPGISNLDETVTPHAGHSLIIFCLFSIVQITETIF